MEHYRDIPKDKTLRFKATPGFKGWKHFFVGESITHPAKMNLNLLRWILSNYTEPSDLVLDPMAGTGSTIILAATMGRHAIAVEYESKFCKMIEENIWRAHNHGTLTSKGKMSCINGDARELSKYLNDSDIIISSPPYGNRLSDVAIQDGDSARMGYRQTIDVVLTSPPYGKSHRGGGIFKEGYRPGPNQEITDPNLPKRQRYPLSDDPLNIDNLEYGIIDTVITSPPYEGGPFNHAGGHGGAYAGGIAQRDESLKPVEIGENNIGNLKGETYLEAMLQVYQECYKVLSSLGRMVLVTKNFIRDKQIIRLDLDTIKLCESVGFNLIDHWYFELPIRSFWKILYHKKYPDVHEVKYEDILVFQKNGVIPPRGSKDE